MRTRVQKWGNSLAVRIPRSFAEEIGLREHAPVDLSLESGKLLLQPVLDPAISLEQLLAGITDENRHGEIDTSPAVGREDW